MIFYERYLKLKDITEGSKNVKKIKYINIAKPKRQLIRKKIKEFLLKPPFSCVKVETINSTSTLKTNI